MRRLLWLPALLVLVRAAAAAPIELPKKISQRPQLVSIYAGTHQFDEFMQDDTRAVVCIFMGRYCPVAQQYIPRLIQLHEKYRDRGVQMLAVYSNSGVDLMSMAVHAHDSDLPFPALLDTGGRLAGLLDAQVTPDVIVVDSKWEKRYHGPVDNQFTKRGRLREPTRHYLEDAIQSILAGRPVEPVYVAASGCPIERQPPPPSNRKLTYHRDVAPIIQRNCQGCHRPDEVGPFELLTFEDVYYNATKIAEVVDQRRMPPWHGRLNPKFGKLANDRSLGEREINTILDWVRGGGAEGDARDAPPPVKWPRRDTWQIGKPDFVYQMPQPFRVPKTGVLDYQFFRVKMNLPEDRWFQAVEVRPGNPEVVHHIGLHVVEAGDRQYTGFAGMAALYGLNTERARLINDYVPGDLYAAKVYPPHQAVRIPKGSDLVYELHYTPNNRESATDQSMVAFRWAKGPPREEVFTEVFRKPIGRFRIPPHHPHFKMEDTYYFKEDVEIDAIRPHFHYRGKSFRLEIVHHDERTGEIVRRESVLTVPVWDPDWQRTYELATPLRVDAGTELIATGHFDNSAINPNNPDPSATVLWGQQTTDEMFSTRFIVRRAKPRPVGPNDLRRVTRGRQP